MLYDCPLADQEHFRKLGDGYVNMPLGTMENFLYPTLRVMQHLHSNKGRYEHIPGGVESMMCTISSIKGEEHLKTELNTTSRYSGTPPSPQGATFLINYEPIWK